MKGISPLLSAIFLVAITVTISLIAGSFVIKTAENSSSLVAEQSDQRLRCMYAEISIRNATFDAGMDCTSGVNHTLNVTIKNTGQTKMEVSSAVIENTEGELFIFSIDRNMSSGETRTFIIKDSGECTGIVSQRPMGYSSKIKNIHLTTLNCPSFDSISAEYTGILNANQSEAMPGAYSSVIWHFNNSLEDSSQNNNDGSFIGEPGPNYVAGISSLFGNAVSFDGIDDYVNFTVAQTKETTMFWYRNSSEAGWTHVANVSGTTYVNGSLAEPAIYPVYISGNNIQVGKTSDSGFFNGTIDEILVYSTALSTQEIQDSYMKGAKES